MASYDSAYYASGAELTALSAKAVLPLLLHEAKATSVVDVGCGQGAWLAVADQLGCDVCGLDGSWVDPAALQVAPERFRPVDLAQPLDLSESFDLAISLEVAEHLPPERSESFVADLVSLAPAVGFAAAIPNQGGRGHINERWPEYWRDLFANHGYGAVDCVRPVVWDQRIGPWYAQNLMLYLSGREEKLRMPLRVVHPDIFVDRSSPPAPPRTLRDRLALGERLRRRRPNLG